MSLFTKDKFSPLSLKSLAVALVVAFVALGALSSDAEAKRKGERPVSDSTAADLLSLCMIDDGTLKQGRTYVRCCHKGHGFCIKCPKNGAPCQKSKYRISPWAGQLKYSGGAVVAKPDKETRRPAPSRTRYNPAPKSKPATDRLKVD